MISLILLPIASPFRSSSAEEQKELVLFEYMPVHYLWLDAHLFQSSSGIARGNAATNPSGLFSGLFMWC